MAKQMLDLDCTLEDILESNDSELRALADKAIHDMVDDTISRYKDQGATRKVIIEIGMVRMDDMIRADYKVTPKAAPYSRVPEKDMPTASSDQLTIYEVMEDAEVISPDHQIGCSAE